MAANSLFSVLSWAVPATAYFVALPITVRGLGSDAYGVLVLVTAVAGYMGLMELGLGQSLIRYISHHRALSEGRTVRAILQVGLGWFLAAGCVGAVGLMLAAPWLATNVLRVPAGYASETVTALRLTGVNVVLGMAVSLGAAVPQSFLRFDISGGVQGALGTAFAVGPAVLVTMGHGIVAIVLFSIAVNVVAVIIYYAVTRRLLRTLNPGAGPSWREIRSRTLRFASIIAVSRIQTVAVAQTSRLVIGYTQGAASAGYYQVPSLIAARANDFLNRLATAIFPTGTHLLARDDTSAVRALYMRTSRLLFLLNASITSSVSVLAAPLLLYWVGPEFSSKGSIALVLLMTTQGAWAMTMSAGNLNMAAERPGLLFRYTFLGSLLTLGALYPMSARWGVTGAAVAGQIGTVVVPFILVHTHRAVLGVSTWDVVRRCYVPTLLGTGPCAVAGHVWLAPLCDGLASTLVYLLALGIGCIVVSGLFGAITAQDLRTLRRIMIPT